MQKQLAKSFQEVVFSQVSGQASWMLCTLSTMGRVMYGHLSWGTRVGCLSMGGHGSSQYQQCGECLEQGKGKNKSLVLSL